MTTRRAVFLDRDGTLVQDPGFLKDPEDVSLLPGAAEALTLLAGAGYAIVIVTNQSGIGRGLLTEDDYHRVRGRVAELLAASINFFMESAAPFCDTSLCPASTWSIIVIHL